MKTNTAFNSLSQGWSSLDTARWHMKNSKLAGTSWSVALVISMYHNKDRGYAFPTIEKLVKETPFSRRSVSRAIQEMKESGEWHIVSGRGGPNSSSRTIARANRYYPLPKTEGVQKIDSSKEVDESLLDQDSEVSGWHLTPEESGARVTTHPHSEVSGWHVTNEESGARVTTHPPSDMPGCPPKREYTLKEREKTSSKREKKEKEIPGEGRSSSISTVEQNSKRDRPLPQGSFSSSSTLDNIETGKGKNLSREELLVKVSDSLDPSYVEVLEKELASLPERSLGVFFLTLEGWGESNFNWLSKNSSIASKRGEKIRSLTGWIMHFGGKYEPHSSKDASNPDKTSNPEDYHDTL